MSGILDLFATDRAKRDLDAFVLGQDGGAYREAVAREASAERTTFWLHVGLAAAAIILIIMLIAYRRLLVRSAYLLLVDATAWAVRTTKRFTADVSKKAN